MRVDVLKGNIFEGGADLTVLPCSPKPSVSPFTRNWIDLFRLADPLKFRYKLELGGISKVYNFRHRSRKTRKYVYAASVLNDYSDVCTLVRIGQQIGDLSKQNRDIRQIETPLLGTGAGGLGNDVAARSLATGFHLSALSGTRLLIFAPNEKSFSEAVVSLRDLQHELASIESDGADTRIVDASEIKEKSHLYDEFCVCPNCHKVNALKVQKTDTRPQNYSCAYCHVALKFSRRDEVQTSIRVEGSNAGEVEKVLGSTLTRIGYQEKVNHMQQADHTHQDADIAILVALDKELNSLLESKGHWEEIQNDNDIRTYYKTITPAGVRVVAARASEMGQLGSSLLARDIIDRFAPRRIILTGIAAGLDDDVALGDIVISDQIVDYELGKVKGGTTTPRWSAYRSDALLRERLFDSKKKLAWTKFVRTDRPDQEAAERTKVHTGVVLSGNKVIADADAAGSLKSVWTRALALEMEAAGIAAAIHQMSENVGFVMVKSICDHADESKNDDWQQYASEAAAAFVISYIFDDLSPNDAMKSTQNSSRQSIDETLEIRTLRVALSTSYDMNELRVLASDMSVDWDNIAGETKDVKVTELIKFMKRRGTLSRLINTVNEDRGELLSSYQVGI